MKEGFEVREKGTLRDILSFIKVEVGNGNLTEFYTEENKHE